MAEERKLLGIALGDSGTVVLPPTEGAAAVIMLSALSKIFIKLGVVEPPTPELLLRKLEQVGDPETRCDSYIEKDPVMAVCLLQNAIIQGCGLSSELLVDAVQMTNEVADHVIDGTNALAEFAQMGGADGVSH
jgi:hypothetical protein